MDIEAQIAIIESMTYDELVEYFGGPSEAAKEIERTKRVLLDAVAKWESKNGGSVPG